MSYKEEFEAWLATRPKAVQELAAKYPPGDYKMKEDAPYGVTAPGCTVNLISYREDGLVGVVILAKDKSEAALEHETRVAKQHGRTDEEIEEIHKMDVKAHVDPQWLELVHNELED